MDQIQSQLQNVNWTLALATAVGSLGGFPIAPQWFQRLAQQPVVQVLLLAVLVYQGGGGQNVVASLVVAGLVYVAIQASVVLIDGGSLFA